MFSNYDLSFFNCGRWNGGVFDSPGHSTCGGVVAFFVTSSARDMWVFDQRGLFLVANVNEINIIFIVVMSVGECDAIV